MSHLRVVVSRTQNGPLLYRCTVCLSNDGSKVSKRLPGPFQQSRPSSLRCGRHKFVKCSRLSYVLVYLLLSLECKQTPKIRRKVTEFLQNPYRRSKGRWKIPYPTGVSVPVLYCKVKNVIEFLSIRAKCEKGRKRSTITSKYNGIEMSVPLPKSLIYVSATSEFGSGSELTVCVHKHKNFYVNHNDS